MICAYIRNHTHKYFSVAASDHNIYTPQITGKLWPFAAMATYLKNKVKPCLNEQHHPLNSQVVNHSQKVAASRTSTLPSVKYNPKNFNTHSFRISVATSAAHAGVSTSLIKVLGRWRSDGYRRYTRSHRHWLISCLLMPG